jgi:hypothetical protein
MFAVLPRGGDGRAAAMVLREVRLSPSPSTSLPQDRDRERAWTETAQMALFGIGLSYLGVRLGKRRA